MLIELTTNGKLDAVLEWLTNEFINDKRAQAIQYRYAGCRTKHEISLGVSFFKQADHIYELDLVLEYLNEIEHCIRKQGVDGTNDCYRIEYKGMILIQDGGYTKRSERETLRQTWEDGNVTQARTNEERLIRVGWGATIGTGTLALIEILKQIIPLFLHKCQ